MVIVLGGTSYSLVQLFLLSDVSFSHNTPSHFVTVVQTDDSIMTITDRPTKLAWRCKHALEKDNNKYCANTPRLFARCCTFKIVFSYSAIQPQVCLIIIIIIIIIFLRTQAVKNTSNTNKIKHVKTSVLYTGQKGQTALKLPLKTKQTQKNTHKG